MSTPSISHKQATIKNLKNHDYAVEYLNAVLEDGTQEKLRLALRRVATAHGMRKLAEEVYW